MAGTWRRLAAVTGARLRHRRRLGRILLGALLVLVGIGFFGPSADDTNPLDNVDFTFGVLFFLTAATFWVWRAAPTELPALRWRLRFRRVCLRGSVLALYGACLGLLGDAWFAYRRDALPADAAPSAWDHLDHLTHVSGTVGLWLLLLAPVPALLEVPMWRLMPRPLRRAVMVDKVTEELADPRRSLVRGELPQQHHPAPGRPGAPIRLDPAVHQYRLPIPAERLPAFDWDGDLLRVRLDRRRTYAFRLEGAEPRPATLAQVTEDVGASHRRWVVLLDARGDRLLAVRSAAFDSHMRGKRLAALARSANLAFDEYNLGWAKDARGSLALRVFPPVAHARRVRRAARALAAGAATEAFPLPVP